MPVQFAIPVAAFMVIASLIGLAIFAASRRRAAQEDELTRVASARGWSFESTLEKGYRVHRWSGTTDGISWIAESLRHTGAKGQDRKRRIARWHGHRSPGITGAIVVMGLPTGKEDFAHSLAEGDGVVATLVKKVAGFAFDKAIDAYFGDGPGKEVDAGAMHRIATQTPGFVVMAADKSEGACVLEQWLEHALIQASSDKGSVLSNDERPWILLRPKAISIARMERFRDVNEIESFIRAGVALTRTSRFGRPSL
ncbi:MAG: hypothetical protein ABI039_04755 [Vicinamibacterales bacterium]